MLLLRVGRLYTVERADKLPLKWRFAAHPILREPLALHWVGFGVIVEVFYGWHGHSVDIDIERQHEGFEACFFRYPL